MNLLLVCVICSSLCGCIYNSYAIKQDSRSKEQYEQDLLITERNKIFAIYDKNIPNNIILAYEKVYGNTFNIAKNYLQYNKVDDNPTYDGFWIWLIKNFWYKNEFIKGDEFGIYQGIINNRANDKDYIEVKKNYELLEKMQNAKN